MSRIAWVSGGPFANTFVREPLRPGLFRWIGEDGYAHKSPRPGRVLYERHAGFWRYAFRCEDCGVFMVPANETVASVPVACPLCGAARP